MPIYTKITDFQVKDALASGNPLKIVKGQEIDDEFDSIAAADASNYKKDGTVVATDNLPMGGFKHTNLGAGTAATDSVNLGQVQSSAFLLIGSISGTNTITGSLTPAISSYAAGQQFSFVSAGANTGPVTININGLGAKAITKNGSEALVSGDIPANAVIQITYDGTRFQLVSGAGTGGGATGAGNDKIFFENDLLVTDDYTIGERAMVSGATITIASPAVITLENHGFVANQPVRFETTGALPTGLSADAMYYVISTGLTTDTFQVSTSEGGAAVNTSGTQSGVHSVGKIKGSQSSGDVVVNDGVTVTVPTGSVWVVN